MRCVYVEARSNSKVLLSDYMIGDAFAEASWHQSAQSCSKGCVLFRLCMPCSLPGQRCLSAIYTWTNQALTACFVQALPHQLKTFKQTTMKVQHGRRGLLPSPEELVMLTSLLFKVSHQP